MQKIIICAILAAVAFGAAQNIDQGTGTTATPVPMTVTKAGYMVLNGVFQKCHTHCLTCSGPLINECVTCHPTFSLSGTNTCACTTTTDKSSADAGTPKCTTADATNTLCKTISAYADGTSKECVYCPNKFDQCSDATTIVADATGCWAGLTAGSTTACTYTDALNFVTRFDNLGYAKTDIINGYGNVTADKEFVACNKGCLTCDLNVSPKVLCASCATGFSLKGTTKTECECPAAGNFYTQAGALSTAAAGSAADSCTACQTGCVTCSSATVCTVCDSSTHKLGSTTDSSSTCESLSSTDTSATTSTTDGEKDGESTSTTATDATSTNGVLLTAASMLLAVILA